MKLINLVIYFNHKNPKLKKLKDNNYLILYKLIYFSNLMYYSIYGKNLIEYDFKNLNYNTIKNLYTNLKNNNKLNEIDKDIKKILDIVNFIYYNDNISLEEIETINFVKMDEKEITEMKLLYSIYKELDFDNLKYIKVNRTTYYYFNNDLEVTDDILEELSKYNTMEELLFLEKINGELVVS